MIDLKSYLVKEHIIFNLPAKNKIDLLEKITDIVSEKIQNIDRHLLLTKLIEREDQLSTGVINKFGIPHCRLNYVEDDIKLFIVRLKNGVDFDSNDNEKIECAFFIICDENASNKYLQVLSSIAYIIQDESNRAEILATKNPDELLDKILSLQDYLE
jgi:nitrogen PTS system EIIA component